MTKAELVAIRTAAQARGVTRLCHFTQSRKLAHILASSDGIRCVADLKKSSRDILDSNDPLRLDNRTTHINCSVEYPNYWMLRQMRTRETFFEDWAVLLVAPDFIWASGTLFSPRNAAAGGGSQVQGGLAAFEGMFAPKVAGAHGRVRVRSKAMLSSCPTDDMAEVMIQSRIPRDKILGVAFKSDVQALTEVNRLKLAGVSWSTKWIVAEDAFSDQASVLIRKGIRPTEREIDPYSQFPAKHLGGKA